MAAVLACGRAARLSYRSAVLLHGARVPEGSLIDVTVPGSGGRPQPGIFVHRSRTLAPVDLEFVDGIPCTSPARTLIDIAEVVRLELLERILERFAALGILDLTAVLEVLARSEGRRGRRKLRRALAIYQPTPAFTRSELERRFIRICRKAGLPQPRANAWLPLPTGGFEVDFVWEEYRLVVELDGWETHGTRRAFEADRQRDRELTLAGYRVLRFTWAQVVGRSEEVVASLAALLGRG